MACQDEVKDKMGANPKESDIDRYRGQFEDCVVKCAESNMKLIPGMLKRMKETISSGSYSVRV